MARLDSGARKHLLLEELRRLLGRENWGLVAWVVLNNHYHVLAQAPESGGPKLAAWVGDLHKLTARRWNDEDGCRGRKVWWNYWDTCITTLPSFWARVNYVHWNPVKHGLVRRPEDYAFSSYREYLAREDLDIVALERAYPFDRVRVKDDF